MSAAVELIDYNPAWPEMFEAEKTFLMQEIGQWLQGQIEHVGSTAIMGMMAKPVIDIMFGVASLQQSSPAIERLQQNGYCYYPYKANVMHWFCKPSDEYRTHHLHLVPYQSDLWNERICFRDRLTANPALAQAYAELKKSLAFQHQYDREAYTQKKWPFIKQVLNQKAT